MAKSDEIERDQMTDPLADVPPLDPDELEKGMSGPPSPLASTQAGDQAGGAPEFLLVQAGQQVEQLRNELAREREARRRLEKRSYQLEAAAEQAEQLRHELAEERRLRADLELRLASLESDLKRLQELEADRKTLQELQRETGTLKYKADRLDDLAAELNEERKRRVELEREKATLEIEVQHAAKMEQLLTEERQARANAQLRASTAEAKLAQREGEMNVQRSQTRSSFWSRLRGR